MSTVEIVPAPIRDAKRESARGLENASEPKIGPKAMDAAAPALQLAPEPDDDPKATELTARVHDISPAPIPGTQTSVVAAQGNEDDPPVVRTRHDSHSRRGDGWIELRVWAEMLYDAQKVRIGCENRIERAPIDRGYFASQLAAVRAAEDELAASLRECYRRIVPQPIRDWQKNTPGIGEPALARLLGHLGHPAIANPHHWIETPHGLPDTPDAKRILLADEPYLRSLRQLWAYCGHGDPARKRAKGMDQMDALAMGSPVCKMIVHELLAASCIKSIGATYEKADGSSVFRRRSPFRDVYDARRLVTADREDWTLAHKHNDALRITGKEILRDLWVASRTSLSAPAG